MMKPPIITTVDDVKAWLKAQGYPVPTISNEKKMLECKYLMHDEHCTGTEHYSIDSGAKIICPAKQAKERLDVILKEVQHLKILLKKILGYVPLPVGIQGEISQGILRSMKEKPEIQGQQELLKVIKSICKNLPLSYNMGIIGTTGVGKTTAQLALHFAHLESGFKSAWMQTSNFRSLFRRLNAFDSEIEREAQKEFNQLCNANIIHWTDMGESQGNFAGDFTERLLMLLDYSEAYWVFSSNLTIEELEAHPELGKRIVSRILSTTNGTRARVLVLKGPDQRIHGG